MIVADASAVVEALLGTSAGRAVTQQLFEAGETVHAPHLIDLEVAHVIRRYVAIGDIDEARGRAAIRNMVDIQIRRYPHDVLLHRVWELRGNLSAYDAVYVALAETLDAPLLTRDRRLADAARRFARCQVV